jgi:lipopolysaccharide/colanic/teichoic acid biosynthesis glycosyltransferase
MFDFHDGPLGFDEAAFDVVHGERENARGPWSKVLFDVVLSVLLLVPLVVITLVLILLNPFLNAGPLVFLQRRMGQDCQSFIAIKFRTMQPGVGPRRGAFDALEVDRISGFGRFLRKTRIDELPQILNVLRGEMSLIGPRPDLYDHARVYLDAVPGYAARHTIMPGISGFAQTEVGYVDGLDGVHRKVAADLYYAANASFGFDLWIAWRTICVVLGRKGS